MSHVMWNARCKSGYQFNGKPCHRVTRRGALFCDDCLSAEVMPTAPRVGMVTRIMTAVVAVWQALTGV